MPAVVLLLALLARKDARSSRAAARFARSLLGEADPVYLARLSRGPGL